MNKFGDGQPTVLVQIHEGMDVYDANEDKIGTVSYVRLTDEKASEIGPETATISDTNDPYDNTLVRNLVEAFVGDDDLPQEIRRRLLREGFVRVDTGILRADRYVTPDQISHVSDENVYLSVTSDAMIRS